MAQRRNTLNDFDSADQVGDWWFSEDGGYLVVRLFAGENGVACLCIKKPTLNYAGPVWQWDGNRAAPTLSPSILHHSTPEWHGYLEHGVLRQV